MKTLRKSILPLFLALLAALLPDVSVQVLQGQGRKVNTNIYTPPSIRERYANQPGQRPQVPFPRPTNIPQNPALANLPVILKIRYEDDRVTADMRNAPIQQALEELAARTGVVFEVSSTDNDPISISLFRISLQEAVQRIVGPGNSIAYFGRDESGLDRLLFVRVLARKNPNAPTSLRYLGVGAITKTVEDVVETPDQAIKALATSDSVDLRQKAIETLAASKSELATAALTIALDDPAPEVRVASVEGLAGLGARPVLPKIVGLLKDEHPGVRRSAIVAIALLGDATSLRDLRPMGKDPDPSVVAEAETAIKQLSTRRP